MSVCHKICSSRCGDIFLWCCRLCGLLAVIAIWGVAAETVFNRHYLGYYLLALACVSTVLEVTFGITYFIEHCFSVDSHCRSCWSCVLWLDDWKKCVLYYVLCIPCFVQPVDVKIAIIPGIMLIVSGSLYLLKTFKTRDDRMRKTLAQTSSYDKFDELHEDILDDDDDDYDNNDNDNTNVLSQTATMMENHICDQQEILEV